MAYVPQVPVPVPVPRRKLGSQGLEVSTLGLGCSGLSGAYGTYASEEDAISLFQHAFNRGVTFFDTSDVYADFANEILVGKALKHLPRERVQLATKFGRIRKDNKTLVTDGSAAYVRKACESSLVRLGVDYIDLYFQHRVDTQVPIEETVGELKKLVEEEKVKYIGLCEASIDTIRRAHAVHPITALQCEWSLWSRDIEEEIIPTCRELGIGIVSYSPLGRGFFSGTALKEGIQENTRLTHNPRFTPENLKKNKVFFERVSNLAKKHGCTPGQLALSWVIHQGDDVVPIPGTTKINNLDENICSLNVKLLEKDMTKIIDAIPQDEVAGLRYAERLYQCTWKFANTPPLKI